VPGPTGIQGDVGETGRRAGVSYFSAEKRLSNELLETIGCAPAIAVPDVLAVGCSAWAGFACAVAAGLVSAGFGAGAGFDTFFASIARGLAGGALAVVSEPPIPILRARLVKKPSDFAEESAEATRVAGAGAGAGGGGATATTGSGACGGLTVCGNVVGVVD